MSSIALRHLRSHQRRLLGVALAIMIGAGFLAATLLAGRVIDQAFRNSVAAEYRHIDLVVVSADGDLPPAAIEAVAATPGVAAVQRAPSLWLDASAGGHQVALWLADLPVAPALRDGIGLVAGHLPERPGEVVLNHHAARSLRIEPGDTFELGPPESRRTMTLVGTWAGEGRFGPLDFDGFLTPEDAAAWSGLATVPEVYVLAEPGARPGDLARTLAPLLPEAARIATAGERVNAELTDVAGEMAIQKAGITAFAVLAFVVAGIVVANTFAILVAQRTREIALLRCAGATTTQVRRLVLLEAAVIGLVSAVAGIAAAALLVNALLAAVNRWAGFRHVPASIGLSAGPVLGPVLGGAILAVIAASGPARVAAAIEPLRALRAAHLPAGEARHSGPARLAAGILLLAGGAVLLVCGMLLSQAGSRGPGVLAGLAGGCLSFLGVVALSQMVVPAVVALASRAIARTGHVPARVAASNSLRNPRRTTATSLALVIGVALVTMMSVGAATLQASMLDEVDATTPWDVEVLDQEAGDNSAFQSFASDVATLDGVAAVTAFGIVEVTIAGGPAGDPLMTGARVVDPGSLAATWRDSSAIDGFGAGTVLVPAWMAELAGVAGGDILSLGTGAVTITARVIVAPGFEQVLLARADVAAAGVDASTRGFWLRIDGDADANAVFDALTALGDERGAIFAYTGISDYRQAVSRALDMLVLVMSGLLAVAVAIAVIGVGNTLSLSVIERTRESTLLRALGFTRGQLRQSLAVEGVLLALVGGVIGIALGIAYGWIGAVTVVGDAWPVRLAFPLGRIALILAVAVVAGLVASTLPARQAARADPVTALAGA